MIHVEEFLWCFSIFDFCFQILRDFVRIFHKNLSLNSCSYSSSPPTLPWMHFCSPLSFMNGFETRDLKNHSKNLSVVSKKRMVFAAEEEQSYTRQSDSIVENMHQDKISSCKRKPEEDSKSEGLNSLPSSNGRKIEVPTRAWKRPGRITIPKHPVCDFADVVEVLDNKDFEVQGTDFFLASKRGRKPVMEDGYSVIPDILGNPKQAFFGVFDGHGGRAAVDYATENLGKNILAAMGEVGKADHVEEAIREGYLTTDKDFLSKGQCSGACVATVLLKDGELYVANAGDCRVVLSRKGVASALTRDHRVNREDERSRIQSLGGYVSCRNGVWRAQDTLAVSRAIGDQSLKEWITFEPDIKKLLLTPDCEFLIVASDGLWDKVNNQEAVDVVLRHKITLESCKELVDMSSSKGNRDDATVMVINLQNFMPQVNCHD